MRAFDLSPLLRSTVGFDHFDRLFETVARMDESAQGYPPYNIEAHDEDRYRVTLAVAGFAEDDLDITVQDRTLIVSGKAKAEPEGEQVRYLHRGIARRAFERRFALADTIRVAGASLENGLLQIELIREVPEAMKPRKIKVERARPAIEGEAQAA
ncbi:MAG: Hsp20 family protein [Alphaproteobacteria bacterium]|nr:Hsp20 family protein [Alphaproteobacteria bacterium]